MLKGSTQHSGTLKTQPCHRSHHLKAYAPSGDPCIILIPALHACQFVLTLVFILHEDWISHLEASWKFL